MQHAFAPRLTPEQNRHILPAPSTAFEMFAAARAGRRGPAADLDRMAREIAASAQGDERAVYEAMEALTQRAINHLRRDAADAARRAGL